MKKLLGMVDIVAGVIIFFLSVSVSGDVASLYQAEDARQLSATLTSCAMATNQLGKNYGQFHEKLLPAVNNSVSAAYTLIVQLNEPSHMMYSVACFNFKTPKFSWTRGLWLEPQYPFESWQEPIKTFRDETRPNVEQALASSAKILADFEKNTSPQIAKTFPQISGSLQKASQCIARQEKLNQSIAGSINLLGVVCSVLLLITGLYHLHQPKVGEKKE